MIYLLQNRVKNIEFLSPQYIFDIEKVPIIQRLFELQDGVNEIICHPGYVDEELKQISRITDAREMELQQLVAPSIKKIITEQKIVLTNYEQL